MECIFLGFVESYGDNDLEGKSLSELKEDNRLIVADDCFIFTSSDSLEEVKNEYKIESVFSMTEWLRIIYIDNYHDYVSDEFVAGELVSEEEFEKAIYDKVSKLGKEDLLHLKVINLFQIVFKKLLIEKLTSYVKELESDIQEASRWNNDSVLWSTMV